MLGTPPAHARLFIGAEMQTKERRKPPGLQGQVPAQEGAQWLASRSSSGACLLLFPSECKTPFALFNWLRGPHPRYLVCRRQAELGERRQGPGSGGLAELRGHGGRRAPSEACRWIK